MSGKYPLEHIFDSEGRKITDPSDLKPLIRPFITTTGSSPAPVLIDMAVPSYYILYLGHSGYVNIHLENLNPNHCVTVEILIYSNVSNGFYFCDDKGNVLSTSVWLNQSIIEWTNYQYDYLISITSRGFNTQKAHIHWYHKLHS